MLPAPQAQAFLILHSRRRSGPAGEDQPLYAAENVAPGIIAGEALELDGHGAGGGQEAFVPGGPQADGHGRIDSCMVAIDADANAGGGKKVEHERIPFLVADSPWRGPPWFLGGYAQLEKIIASCEAVARK